MGNDWWSRHLGTPAPQQPQNLPQTMPTQYPTYIAPQYQPNPQVAYDPNSDQLVSKAQTLRMTERCPGCNSGNYFAPTGTKMMRCYDCGYPVVQSGTGAGMPGGQGASTPAKQSSTGNNFNPRMIGMANGV
jgi:hypothetical protein